MILPVQTNGEAIPEAGHQRKNLKSQSGRGLLASHPEVRVLLARWMLSPVPFICVESAKMEIHVTSGTHQSVGSLKVEIAKNDSNFFACPGVHTTLASRLHHGHALQKFRAPIVCVAIF